MVRMSLSFNKTLNILVMLSLASILGCSKMKKETDIDIINEALKQTENIASPDPGSIMESNFFERFTSFYEEYNMNVISSSVDDLYAENAFFADPYHNVQGITAIEHYFLAMAEPTQSCKFNIEKIQRSENDFYCRWTMYLISKAAPNEKIIAQGLTHMRININGKIIFHQDYWDTSILLDRLPVVGFWTKIVKNRILKGIHND